jgi:hypothetical protein
MNKAQAIAAAREVDVILARNCGTAGRDPSGTTFRHLRWMVAEIEKDEMSEGKTMRWLGYIQGVIVAQGFATLDQMKALSARAAGKETT